MSRLLPADFDGALTISPVPSLTINSFGFSGCTAATPTDQQSFFLPRGFVFQSSRFLPLKGEAAWEWEIKISEPMNALSKSRIFFILSLKLMYMLFGGSWNAPIRLSIPHLPTATATATATARNLLLEGRP